jgi:starvation-inducible DNA-binding protein
MPSHSGVPVPNLREPSRSKRLVNVGLGAFFAPGGTRGEEPLYPERGMQFYLVLDSGNSGERAMLPSNHVLSSRMKTSVHDGRNLAKSNPKRAELLRRRDAPLETRTDLTSEATRDISATMNAILADVFALYVKTKNFHWHMSGHHFRDYHLLLDEHGDQLFAMTDVIAERVRKIGGLTLHSIGEIARNQRVLDNDAEYVEPLDMLAELMDDNKTLAARLREAHNVCDEHRDVATASFIEVWIDETERRTWFLFEATRQRN